MSNTEDPTDQDIVDAFDDLEADEQHALVSLAKTLGYSDPVQRAREAATSRRGFLGTVAGATAAGTMAYSAGKAQAGTNQVGTIGTETKPVDVEAEDIVAASIDTPRLGTDGRSAEWVVYNDGGTWKADGPSGSTKYSGSEPWPVLQSACDDATNSVKLKSGVGSGNPIAQTVTIPAGVDFEGPGNRGTATVYGDASPVFRAEGLGSLTNIWVRGDHSTAKGDNDLILCHEMGRGSFIGDVTVSRTTQSGLVMAGCQQMNAYNLNFAATGSTLKTGGLKFRDNDAGDLGTNACVFMGLHFHGTAEAGPWITAENVNGHGPGLVNRFIGINGENGPPGYPCFYNPGMRDLTFSSCNIMGIDSDVNEIWRLDAGPPRCSFRDITVTGAPARVWNVTGEGIDVTGARLETGSNTIMLHDTFGQATNPDRFADVAAPEASDFVTADGFGDIYMDDVQTSGSMNLTRASVWMSNSSHGGWIGANQSDKHAKLHHTDERAGDLTWTGATNNSNGQFVLDIGSRGFKMSGDNVTAGSLSFTATGSFDPAYYEVDKQSNDGDGDTEVVGITVYDSAGAKPADGVCTADIILTTT